MNKSLVVRTGINKQGQRYVIKRNLQYYSVYVEDKFICNTDTVLEALFELGEIGGFVVDDK